MFVADLFHPIDGLTVELFYNSDMRHRGGRGRAVLMLDAGRTPDYIPGPDFLFAPIPALRPAAAGRDDQRLSKKMGMPCRPRSGFEGDQGAKNTCGIGRFEQGIDPHRPGEIFGWSLARRP